LRDGGVIPATAAQKPMRAFVPLDGSPLSETALEPAALLLTALSPLAPKVMHLMRVVDVPPSYGKFRSSFDTTYDAGVRAEVKHEYQEYLDTVAKRFTEGDFAKYNFSVMTAVPIDMDVAEAIVQAAEQAEGTDAGYDLIVMATHGRGGVQRWMLGSIAERVLHTTRVPLMIVHALHAKHKSHEEKYAVANQ
jgi:nucleotide-binding universal stress UspA family protein